jgi:sigma-B regulation protein RsbU (phosphoserine phosphatase)
MAEPVWTDAEAEKMDLRAIREELRIARQIQQGLFPACAPALRGFDIAGASCPLTAAGGDYFDFIPMLDGSLGLVLGDACGHGVGAAILMATTRAYLRALCQTHSDVRTILTLVNRMLAADTGENFFVTLLLAQLDPRSRTLVFASAGQSGFILSSTGVTKHLGATGPPLGAFADLPSGLDFGVSPGITLEPGDIILLPTDGLIEPVSQAWFGYQPALDIIHATRHKRAQDIIDMILSAVTDYHEGTPLIDDISAILVKVETDVSECSLGGMPNSTPIKPSDSETGTVR